MTLERGPEKPERRKFLKGLAIGTAAGVAAGTGLFMGRGNGDGKEPEQVPEETGIEKDKKILDVQIRFFESLGKEDFEAISRGKNAQERRGEFMKSLDKRFNTAIEISPGIAQEARDRILRWFDNDVEAAHRNTTAVNLHKARDKKKGELESMLNYYNTGSSAKPPDKLGQ